MLNFLKMETKRIAVKQLFNRGFSAGEIFKQLKCLGIYKVFICLTINRLFETNSCKDIALPGRHRSTRTKEHIKRIREKIRRNPQQSAHKIDAEENVSRKTMQVVLIKDLGFHPYCKRQVQGLTKSQGMTRLQRCEKLIRRHG